MSGEVCYECGQPKVQTQDTSALDGVNWYSVADLPVGESFGLEYANRSNDVSRFEVVGKNTHSVEEQGVTSELWIAFKDTLPGGKFYKKLGRGDSYGYVDWDGAVFEVQAKMKTVTVYEIG